MFCNNCGKTVPDGSAFCNFCGLKIEAEKKPRTCPHCGADAEEARAFCGKCGKPLSMAPTPVDAQERAKGELFRMCPVCGRAITSPDGVCYFCVGSFSAEQETYAEATYTTETAKPGVAAVLLGIAGVLGIVQGMVTFGGVALCCAISVLFGALALAGAYVTAQRSGFLYAVAGAICGIIAVGYGLGAIMAIVALILIAASRSEFGE